MSALLQECTLLAAAAATVPSTTPGLRVALHKVIHTARLHRSLARGGNESAKALKRDTAQLCVLASTCIDQDYIRIISDRCAARNIPLITTVDGSTLADWAGLCKFRTSGARINSVACSCVVVKTSPPPSSTQDAAHQVAPRQWG
jgi:ribosomal protein L7Ae-like RNA K-turn-binding protein